MEQNDVNVEELCPSWSGFGGGMEWNESGFHCRAWFVRRDPVGEICRWGEWWSGESGERRGERLYADLAELIME